MRLTRKAELSGGKNRLITTVGCPRKMIREVADGGAQACSVRSRHKLVCYWKGANRQPPATEVVHCKYDNYCKGYSFVSLTLCIENRTVFRYVMHIADFLAAGFIR